MCRWKLLPLQSVSQNDNKNNVRVQLTWNSTLKTRGTHFLQYICVQYIVCTNANWLYPIVISPYLFIAYTYTFSTQVGTVLAQYNFVWCQTEFVSVNNQMLLKQLFIWQLQNLPATRTCEYVQCCSTWQCTVCFIYLYTLVRYVLCR